MVNSSRYKITHEFKKSIQREGEGQMEGEGKGGRGREGEGQKEKRKKNPFKVQERLLDFHVGIQKVD